MNSNLLLVIAAAVALITGIFITRHARAHDIYSDWTQPNSTASCCHDVDCRVTRAYVDDDGYWRAWTGKRWLIIPPRALLPTDKAQDGRSHLCEKNDMIYCFSPGPPKS